MNLWTIMLTLILSTTGDYVIKNHGDLYYIYNRVWLKFDINISNYHENARIYSKAHEEFLNVCENLAAFNSTGLTINQCDYLLEKQNDMMRQILDDIEYISTMPRVKKEVNWFQMIKNTNFVTYLGAEVLQFVVKKDYLEKVQKYLQRQKASYDDLITIITETDREHQKITERILNVLDNNKNEIIREVTVKRLTETIQNFSRQLSPNYKIPDLQISDLFTISTIKTKIEDKTLSIEINIPIVQRNCNSLYEIIAVPKTVNKKTTIINRNSMYFTYNFSSETTINVIPRGHIKDCKHLYNLTFCNSLTTEGLQNGDKCWNMAILNGSTAFCPFIIIPTENYVVPLGAMGTYIYVSKPTTVRMICDNITTFHNITEFKIIKFENNCQIFKALDFDPKTYFEYMNKDLKLVNPDFDALDTNNWTRFLQIESQTIENQNFTNDQSSVTNFFGKIGNGIFNSIIEPIKSTLSIYTAFMYAVYAVIIILSCCFVNLIIVLCSRIKNFIKA